MSDNHFLKTIFRLRQREEVLLFANVLNIKPIEQREVLQFLHEEYRTEVLNYPHEAPDFDEAAALWAAQTVYWAAQFILYRENNAADLEKILKDFQGQTSPSTMLSADLCLRFLPVMLIQLKMIDPEDEMVEILEKILYRWHYSGVDYSLEIEKLDLNDIINNACLLQLYLNRIIEYKKTKLAENEMFKPHIKSNLGMYADEFWCGLVIS